ADAGLPGEGLEQRGSRGLPGFRPAAGGTGARQPRPRRGEHDPRGRWTRAGGFGSRAGGAEPTGHSAGPVESAAGFGAAASGGKQSRPVGWGDARVLPSGAPRVGTRYAALASASRELLGIG